LASNRGLSAASFAMPIKGVTAYIRLIFASCQEYRFKE
jgi:hypothetical protein